MLDARRFLCRALCLLFWCGLVAAQSMEVIRLRQVSAEQIIPQLQPLLAPGGAITGQGEALFVNTTPANLAALRQMIEVLDRAPRRLMISVRHDGHQAVQRGGSGVSGDVTLGTRNSVRIQGAVGSMQRSGSDGVAQRVQTTEGGRAYIHTGQSMPLPMRQVVTTPQGVVVSDSIATRETGTGFYVEPRLAGERVTLAISTAHDTPGRTPGSAEIRHVVTTVSGRLGEWIPLAGSVQQGGRETRGLGGQSVQGEAEQRQVWLMVEELR